MGRLVPMLGVLLAGVPVLAILQFLGGISFGLLIFQTVNALILLLVVGMQSIRCSTLYSSVGSAVFHTYLRIVGSLFLAYFIAIASNFLTGFYHTSFALAFSSVIFMIINLALGWESLRGAVKSMSIRRRGEDRTLPERAQETIRSPIVLAEMKPAHSETDSEPPVDLVTLPSPAAIWQGIQERRYAAEALRYGNPPVYQNWANCLEAVFLSRSNHFDH